MITFGGQPAQTQPQGAVAPDIAAIRAKYGITPAPKAVPATTTPAGTNIQASSQLDKQSAEMYGASFPAKTGEGPVSAGLKAAGNLPSSALSLGKAVGSAVIHPIDTLSGIGEAALGGIREGVKSTTGFDINPSQEGEKATESFTNVSKVLKDRYGSLENLQRTATNDPVGFATDILSVVGGGAGVIGKGAEASKAIETIAKPLTVPAEAISSGVGKVVSGATKTAAKQISGLDMPTIERILANPEKFSGEAVQQTTRGNLSNGVKSALDNRIDELSATGKEYQPIKEAKIPVVVDSVKVKEVLTKEGIQIGDDGKLVTSAESTPLSPADQAAIEHFLTQYGPDKVTNSTGLLNARKALDNLSSWDAAKTDASDRIARMIRHVYDDAGKSQVPGLREVDAKFSSEVNDLKQLKKDFLNPDGTLKDAAINKIANATGKGKDKLLERLEKLSPGISEKIRDLKAIEDVQNIIEHHKVGNYAKGAGLGYIASAGNPLGIIGGIILSDPSNAVTILRAMGVANKKIQPFIDAIKNNAGAINNIETPPAVSGLIEKIKETPNKQGGFIKIGNKQVNAIDAPTKSELVDAIDYLRNGTKVENIEDTISRLAQKFGYSEDIGSADLANKFQDLIEKTKTMDKLPG